jgi:ATP-dependent RNA helicase DeaD
MTFDDLSLRPELLQATRDLNFTTPTPIQEEAIPHLIQGGRDVVGLAQTGTGKTGAYGLGMLHLLDPEIQSVQAIVVCPTRELCLQITQDIKDFSKHLNAGKVVAVYGGSSIQDQIRKIRKGATILVATPGRLVDLLRRKAVSLKQSSITVLDEADEMLNMGFQEDLEAIMAALPDERRVWLFSATMPKSVARFAKTLLKDPLEITVGTTNEVASNIEHRYYRVHEKHRYVALRRLLDMEPELYGVVFCRTRRETAEIAEKLVQDGYAAEPIHGDLSQAQRDAVMRKFRNKTVRVLVATDVAARGLDVKDLTHVVHYRLPEDEAVYTHRSGRTARAGKSGKSLAIINIKQMRHLQSIARVAGVTFEEGRIPEAHEIGERQLMALVEKVKETDGDPSELKEFMPRIYEAFEPFSKEELIQHFVAAEFNRFLSTYEHAPDINLNTPPAKVGPKGKAGKRGKGPEARDGGPGGRERRRDTSGEHRQAKGMKTFFFGAGKMDGIPPGAIIRTLCEAGSLNREDFGNINIKREFSFVDIREEAAQNLTDRLKHVKVDGRNVPLREYVERSSGKRKKK